ncbi:hypothetical protein CJD36_012155 [Flavipsychrobacter stenotrophus]|uniref:Uncharacterized protein n=2 Tax=Flavipsychrobacter stenotrophus TaxID=2077091 RepID=A0A2S7SVH9_9BACT|nr:hypothetical protein CJD36_012155 [Flavipsychrobacter stenotrophus]
MRHLKIIIGWQPKIKTLSNMDKNKKLDAEKVMRELMERLSETPLSEEQQKMFSEIIESNLNKTEPAVSHQLVIYREHFFDSFSSRPRPLHGQIISPDVTRSTHEVDNIEELLSAIPSFQLTASYVGSIESYLWALSSQAFLYFLPAFMYHSLASCYSIYLFVAELVEDLTLPLYEPVVESLHKYARIELMRKQQLDWRLTMFHDRFDNVTDEEGKAIYLFLAALRETHGEDFFEGIEVAIDRYWGRFESL